MSAGFAYCTGYHTVYPDSALVGYIGELVGIIYEPVGVVSPDHLEPQAAAAAWWSSLPAGIGS